MKNLNQVERIKIKLNLAKHTDSFFEVFGASSHRYRLDAPIDIKEVEAFEKKYNISLPKEYRIFLTQIGNGGYEYKSQVGNSGAGPDYGIFKLGYGNHHVVDPATGYLEKEPFFNSQITREDWGKISENMSEDITDDEYDKEFERVYAGILTISACGCAGYMGIMLSGENKGRVVYIYDELEYCPQFVKEANFLDWYENWLDSIISGQRFIGGYNYTEEENFARYAKDKEPYWKLVSLEYIRSLDSLSLQSLKVLWGNYGSETDETVKLYILNLLAKFDYENAKTELDQLYKSKPLEFLKILHLYIKGKTSDWRNIIQELQDKTLNPEITEYIKYVTTNDY